MAQSFSTQVASSADRGPMGLYAITPDIAEPAVLLPLIERALAGGIDALQFRVKRDRVKGLPRALVNGPSRVPVNGSPSVLEQGLSGDMRPDPLRSAAALRELATAVKQLCDARSVPLIINDDVELACEIEARGVHIGKDDGDPQVIRARLGPSRWLGVSCYNDFDRALSLAPWADHVGFGSLFASSTKPGAVRAPLSLFAQARNAGLHAVGIGGIDRTNAASVIAAGAQAVAIINDLFGDPEPEQSARALRRAIG